jgi:hypothetical protein
MEVAMKAIVSARGYTNVLLVLNMKRFVQEQDQARFERIRGRAELAKTLREIWPQKLIDQEKFITIEEDRRRRGRPENMSTEQVGFATGVFRSLMLERYTFPAYALVKEKVQFETDLMANFQFTNLFLHAWNKWSIYIRATYTGFFIIRLSRRHFDQPRSFIKLAKDVLQLQESLDVPSALNWLNDARLMYANDPTKLSEKEQSINALFAWLGVDEANSGNLLYYPIQWRIAMEVCGLFVKAIGSEISIDGESEPIHLKIPEPSIHLPLHDSYVVHHFTELFADPSSEKGLRSNRSAKNSQVSVDLNDVKDSSYIRQALSNLIEGSVLNLELQDNPLETRGENTGLFPDHSLNIINDIPSHNQSTWSDELCILKSKTAIIMPAPKWRDYQLSISSVPGATLHVNYLRYWGAIERMIEFLIEIRVLTQLVESESYRLLGEIAQTVHETRSLLFSGDIKLDQRLPDLVTRAAYIRHLAALSRSLSYPQLWSRAEYAIQKANHLLGQLGVPTILEHIERNINSINSVVDHVDELYLADLSEKSNESTNRLSLVLAAASLTLTILILPSYWADIKQLIGPRFLPVYQALLPLIEVAGDLLAVILVGSAIYLFGLAISQRRLTQKTNKSSVKKSPLFKFGKTTKQ